MSQYTEGPCRTFEAGAAIAQYLRVKLSSGKLAASGAGVSDYANDLGTMERPSYADGDKVAVRLRNAPGTRKMVAGEALAAGAAIYGAANGKVADTASGTQIGIALEAATADGDVIECLLF